jgi:hypothetical protein
MIYGIVPEGTETGLGATIFWSSMTLLPGIIDTGDDVHHF